MTRLLIVGGTIDVHRHQLNQQDMMLAGLLKSCPQSASDLAKPEDEPSFMLNLPEPYFPFKRKSVFQHRFSQSAVYGLAEIILEQEAAAVGVPCDITSVDKLLDERGNLKNPGLFKDYDMLALSSTFILPSMLFFLTRNIPEGITFFVGGPGAFKVRMEELPNLRFDYFLRTEAEGRFRLLLQHAMGKNIDLNAMPGLSWRENNQLKHSTGAASYIDMNHTILPDFAKMAGLQGGRVVYESARGCTFRCQFCDYPFLMGNLKLRLRSAGKVFEQWQTLHNEMGVNEILCLDALFTFPKQRLVDFCKSMISSGMNKTLKWGCYGRANDLADADTVEIMREAGCEYVYVGFESGSARVLEYMKKGCTVEENHNAIINCDHFGIMTLGLFIAGFPGETPAMFDETRAFLQETPPFMLSVFAWMPDYTTGTRVPIMQPKKMAEFRVRLEQPSPKMVTMWKTTRCKYAITVPWGSYWRHKGMDLQDAWDCIDVVVQDTYEGKIRSISEDFFLPQTMDDPLNMYRKMGPDRAIDFYMGLSLLALDRKPQDFPDWWTGQVAESLSGQKLVQAS